MITFKLKSIAYLTIAILLLSVLAVFAQAGEPTVKWEIGKSKNIVYKWSGHEIGDILNISLSWADSEIPVPEEIKDGITLKEFTLVSPSGSEKEKFELPETIISGLYKIKIESRNATGTIASVLSKKTFEVVKKEKAKAKEPKPGETKIEQLNEEVLDLIKEVYDKPILGVFGDYKLKNTPEAAAKEEKLKTVLKERKKELINLIETDPKQALEVAVLANLREKLPKNIKNDVESPLNTTGTLEIIIGDNFTNTSKSTVDYYLSSDESKSMVQKSTFQNYLADLMDTFQGNTDNITQSSHTKLYFASEIPLAFSGSKVAVTGIKLNPAAVASQVIKEQATTHTTGNKKALVIFLTDFRHKKKWQQFEPKEFTDKFINPILKSYFLKTSHNKISFETDVAGWFNVQTSCDLPALYTQSGVEGMIINPSLVNGIRLAEDSVDMANYTNLIFIYTVDKACDYNGSGSIGDIGVPTKNGLKDLGLIWLPFDINTANPSLDEYKNRKASTLIHEIGHNLGLPHANSLFNCADSNSYGSCDRNEYGDAYDVMGKSVSKGLYNGIYKKQLGWLTNQNIMEVSKSGTYSVAPIELESNSPQILTIPRKKRTIGEQYWAIEYQENSNGAMIRLVESSKSVFMNPSVFHLATPVDTTYLFEERKPTLLLGQIFKDPSEEISIQVLNVEPQKLTVEITFGAQKEKPAIEIIDLPQNNILALGQNYKVTVSPNFPISNDILIYLADANNKKTLIKELKISKPYSKAFNFETSVAIPETLIQGLHKLLTESKKDNKDLITTQTVTVVKPRLVVLEPSGNAKLTEGAKQLIAWGQENLTEGASINIKLLKQSPAGKWKLSKSNYGDETYHKVIQGVINQKTLDDMDTCDKKASDYNPIILPHGFGNSVNQEAAKKSGQWKEGSSSYECPTISNKIKTSCTDVWGLVPIINSAGNNFGFDYELYRSYSISYKSKEYEAFGIYSDIGNDIKSLGSFKISGGLGWDEASEQVSYTVKNFLMRGSDASYGYNSTHTGYWYNKRDITCEYEPAEFSKQTEAVSTIFSGVPVKDELIKDELNWIIPKLSPENKYLIEISCTADPEGKWCEKSVSQPFYIDK
ncbi:MAG: hypothetical protein Q7S73_00635 [bacterium]|nr:hypothetical protein [bacterium]